jgi:uncharacterized membrane protein YgcG
VAEVPVVATQEAEAEVAAAADGKECALCLHPPRLELLRELDPALRQAAPDGCYIGFVKSIQLIVLLTCALCLMVATPTAAQTGEERILSFDSDIVVNPDASMDVTETIRVLAQGYQIKRGIIREFPTVYKDGEGNRVEVGFKLKETRRNGVPDRHEVSRMTNGVSIRIGDPDVYLDPGEYTYTIIYHTTRQLGFFEDHDELYWNVTGTGWDLPIDAASAVVRLPGGIPAADIRTTAYTGAFGVRGKTFTAGAADSFAQFQTTQPLGRYEGLTIVAQWPVGHVARPTPLALAAFRLWKYLSVLLALAGLGYTAIYYWLAWRRVGVDPPAGFITPRETPPNELSPAALRYILHMGVDSKCFTTALITLASKGVLRIAGGKKDSYTITKSGAPTTPLTTEETMLADALFRGGDELEAKQDNWQVFAAAQEALRQSLNRQFENVYFKRNTKELGLGIAISFITFFVLLLLAVTMQTIVAMVAMVLSMALFTALDVMFAMLLPSYTMLGRGVLDGIEGFKLALVGGADEAGEEHPGSRVLIEQYLPYAVALEVHNQWSQRFERALAKRHEAQGGDSSSYTPYMPVWYSMAAGSHSHSYTSFTNFTSNFTSSFNSTISSSSSAPGSSSGGSGGSSGGGGGGGGGGGW